MNRFRRSAVLVAVAIATSMAAHAQQVISFPANDIIYNPSDGMIYASVPGAEGAEGNSIIPLDPNTGLFGTAVFVGSEPDQLAISDDGQFLYVALDGANSVRRFNLATQTPEITFGLGNSSTCGGGLHAEDIQVMPGAAHTVAVSKANNGCSPANEGVTIYDDGVARANSVGGFGSPGGLLPDVIAFSADAKTLYAQDTEVSSKEFIQMAVSASGLSLTTSGVGSPLALDIHFDNGLIYGDNGVAFDPTTVTQAGVYFDERVFIGFEVARPDSQNNLMFLLAPTSSSSTIQLYAFKENQFTEIVEQDLNNVQGNIVANRALPVRRMIRWGANGLAFTTGTQIWLLQLPFITATTSTTTSVISSENPAPFGQPYTLTATVNAGGSVATAATGTMTFTVGNTTPVAVAVNNGVAMYSPPALDFGNYPVLAQYSGDAVYMPSLGSLSQRVTQVASTTTLSASPNPALFGNTATLVATVTGPNGPVNQGEVQFTSSTAGQLCLRVTPDANGHATCMTDFVQSGPQTLTASYDDNITGDYGNSSSGPVAFDVQVATRLNLSSSANPGLFGSAVTFTAQFNIGVGGCGPSANVTFYDGATVLGSQPVQFAPANNYFSQFSTSSLTVGMHMITASYPGDPYCAPENASALAENVQGGSTISIAATAGNIQFRQPVTFTATVVSAGGTPTGSVSFYDNGPLVGTKNLDAGGSASVTEAGMEPGVHTIAVHYDGDTNFLAGDGLLTFYCSPKPH